MADETSGATAVAEAGQTTGATEASTKTGSEGNGGQRKQNLGDIIKETQAKMDGETDETGKDAATEKSKHRQTASERIGDLVKERNEERGKREAAEKRTTDLESKLDTLSSDFANIKKLLETGEITKAKAEEMKGEVKEELQALEIPEELEPYRDTIEKMIDQRLKGVVAPLQEAEEQRQKESAEKATTDFRANVKTTLAEVAGKYPDLFTGDKSEDGMPVFKPEYDEKASELAEKFKMPIGDGTFYNPLLATKEGQEMLMLFLSKPIAEVQKAKSEIEQTKERVQAARKSSFEIPGHRTAAPAKGKVTLRSVIEETKKELGMT